MLTSVTGIPPNAYSTPRSSVRGLHHIMSGVPYTLLAAEISDSGYRPASVAPPFGSNVKRWRTWHTTTYRASFDRYTPKTNSCNEIEMRSQRAGLILAECGFQAFLMRI